MGVKILWLWLVTLLVVSSAFAQSPTIMETEDTIVIRQGTKTVLAYNKKSPPAPQGVDPIFERSGFLHPVTSPKGRVVTDMFPADHPHQQGIFSAWVKTTYDGRAVDFWNLARGTGRVLHDEVISTEEKPGLATFVVDLLHRAEKEPPIDILKETWKISVRSDDPTLHIIDLELTQQALTDKPLIIKKYHYGGFAVRGASEWMDSDEAKQGKFLNDLGSDRKTGNHQRAKWVALSGNIQGDSASIVVLNHPKNFRSPQAARLHPKKPYFCFSPCVDDSFRIDRQHPYHARYRILVLDAKPNAESINQQWKAWAEE